jgi:uncharacterized protein (DUF1684 family)
MSNLTQYEELADYRRSVAELYLITRNQYMDLEDRCINFRQGRNRLFATHPQSALSTEQKQTFTGLKYFDYAQHYRLLIPMDPVVDPGTLEMELPEEGIIHMQRIGRIHFTFDSQPLNLTLFWVQGYGGGIFLPFRDQTNNHETYGGGRYLLDTIKLADLGREEGKLVIDFNYAYNPSCAYNPRWVCPLAPPENWLPAPIRAGELDFSD